MLGRYPGKHAAINRSPRNASALLVDSLKNFKLPLPLFSIGINRGSLTGLHQNTISNPSVSFSYKAANVARAKDTVEKHNPSWWASGDHCRIAEPAGETSACPTLGCRLQRGDTWLSGTWLRALVAQTSGGCCYKCMVPLWGSETQRGFDTVRPSETEQIAPAIPEHPQGLGQP